MKTMSHLFDGSAAFSAKLNSSVDGLAKRKPHDLGPENAKRKKEIEGLAVHSAFYQSPDHATPSFSGSSNDTFGETLDSGNEANGFDIDQHEEDVLSKVNWSLGRRRGPSGLFTCIYDRRRERVPAAVSSMKKKVRFVSDPKLVRIQHFEVEDDERGNVYKMKLLAEQGVDIKHLEATWERKGLETAALNEISHHQQSVDETPWYFPPPVANPFPPLIERGVHSVEKVAFIARQVTTLSALFLNRDNMPDSPEEPVEIIPPRFPQQEPRSIPVSRPGLSPAQPFLELIPRGPLPDELQSPPGAAPPTVAVSNLPVSFPKTVTISASQQSPASTQSPKGAGNLSPRDSLQPSSPANDLISRLLAVTAPDKLSSSHAPALVKISGFPSSLGPRITTFLLPQGSLVLPSSSPLPSSSGSQPPSFAEPPLHQQVSSPTYAPTQTPYFQYPVPFTSVPYTSNDFSAQRGPGERLGVGSRPPARCRFFMTSVGCRHGASCRFEHVRSPASNNR